jgi:hypothetical protein
MAKKTAGIKHIMTSRNKTARVAGILYLILIIGGIISLVYIPSQLIVLESASKTLENITNSELLFRLGIVSGIITFLLYILLPLVLYKLLYEINKVTKHIKYQYSFNQQILQIIQHIT